MRGARRVEDLLVWQLSDKVRRRVRPIVARPEWDNHRTLRRQLEDAAERACPNIKEGFDRYHPLENARFVRIAKGSLGETVEHLSPALAKNLVTAQEAAEVRALCNRARAACINFIRYLETAPAPNVPRTARRTAGQTPHTPTGSDASKPPPELWTDARAEDRKWLGDDD